MISKAALEAVTRADNLSSAEDSATGICAVRDEDVVAELRRLEGLSTGEARQLGREAVIHIGGHVEPVVRRLAIRRQPQEVWWVPSAAVRRQG